MPMIDGLQPAAATALMRGILRTATPRASDPLQGEAEDYARRVLEHLDYVGVLAFEFFVASGRRPANEIAPRVHNSGHWTIEGAECSQFENHPRAITGLPLGSTALRGHCVMCEFHRRGAARCGARRDSRRPRPPLWQDAQATAQGRSRHGHGRGRDCTAPAAAAPADTGRPGRTRRRLTFVLQLPEQPGATQLPVTANRALGNAQRASGLGFVESTEIAAFNDGPSTRRPLGKPDQRFVQRQQTIILRAIRWQLAQRVERQVRSFAAALERAARLRMVHECVTHRQRGCAQEMRVIGPVAGGAQFEVGLVHQLGRLQRVAGAEAPTLAVGHAA
jgi:hypothetical protein